MRGIPPHGAGGYMRQAMAVPERQPSLHEKKPENQNTIGIKPAAVFKGDSLSAGGGAEPAAAASEKAAAPEFKREFKQEPKQELKQEPKQKSRLESKAELEWEHYTSPPPAGSHQLRDYLSAKLDYKKDWQKGPFYLKGHVLARYFLDKSRELYFNIPELYGSYFYRFQKKIYSIETVKAAFGRKIKTWSFADEYWELGIWNPQNLWNPLRASWNGLIGSFVDINAARWSFSLFAGALYLPGSGAKWTYHEGKIFSSSRWFSRPPEQVNILGRSLLDIRYHISHPYTLDLALQQSYIASLRLWAGSPPWKRRSNGRLPEKTEGNNPPLRGNWSLWARGSAGYKPVNSLAVALKEEEYLKIFPEEGKDSQIRPRLTYRPAKQAALSADFGWDCKKLSAVLSFGKSKRLRQKEPSISGQKFKSLETNSDFSYVSAFLKGRIFETQRLQAGYLKSWLQKKGAESAAGARRKIWHGLGFEWQREFFSKEGLKKGILSVKYRHSLLEKGGILSAQALFYPLPKKLYIAASWDTLGAGKAGKESFVGYFRANDYFGLRAGYVF